MKKVFIIASVVLMVASTSFATQVTSSGGSLAIGGSDATAIPVTLTMGLSSNVKAVYENGGGTKPQWYAIATSHLGGKQVYGTAQDITNLYKLAVEKTPGTEATFSDMPTGPGMSSTWSSGTWVKM